MSLSIRTSALRAFLALLGGGALVMGALRLFSPLETILGLLLLVVTDRWIAGRGKVAEPALETFWALYNRANDAVFMRTDSRFMGTSSFTEVNEMACRRLGYSREELLALSPWDIFETREGEALDQARARVAEGGYAIFETSLRTRGGESYPVEIHIHRMVLGGRTVIISVARDLTERKQAEARMRRLTQAMEQSPVSIIITDREGIIEYMNPRLEATSGYTAQELVGRTPRVFQSGFMTPAVYQDLWGAITSGRVWEGEFQNRKKSGDLYWERATISPITDAQGRTTHFVGMKVDVSAQKLLESQLRHSQKLEAVGQLAGGVAHDFNNILQVINGYGTLMQMTLGEADPNRNAVGEILKAAERAAHLTHSLLAFSRKQIMNPKGVDLNAVVTNVEKFLRRVIGEDIQLQVDRAPQPLPVRVDIGQIEQVLMNLATNARDAMPTGGRLLITTEAMENQGHLEKAHGFGRPGSYALITVTDTGKGMDEATLKRIFDPFYTTKEMGRGTGLGLSIVYGIIKQHGGYVTAESRPGEGACFHIYVPLQGHAGLPEAEKAGTPFRVKGTETVLVAEDEPGVRTMVERVLREYGYRVLLAQDGVEAVECFQAHQGEIKLILMDIIMPRMGGRQAYHEIRRLDPQIKVLFTSGYTADSIKTRGDLDQGMELVLKPFQPLDLLRKMRELLDRPLPAAGPEGDPLPSQTTVD